MPGVLGVISGLGGATAVFATYWDDAWHTDRGRDDFLIAPHVLLYGGVLVVALTVATWGLLAWRANDWGIAGVRAVLRQPALAMAGIGGFSTLMAGPIDGVWHAAYGRDAVLWSPPHLLALTGTLALSVGLLAGLRSTSGRHAQVARILAAAGILGSLQVTVLEYDSDVPQFSTVWFLPVAALALCLAVRLLDDLVPDMATQLWAATALTAIRIGSIGVLAALGFSLSGIPPLLLLVALVWVLRRLGLAAATRLVLLGALAPIAWWPVLELQSKVATTVPAGQLPAAVLLGALAGGFVAVIRGDVPWPLGTSGTPAAVALLGLVIVSASLWGATPALAHDPGQGERVTRGQLTVSRSEANGGTAVLELRLTGACTAITPVATVARRAGRTLRGPLSWADRGSQRSTCVLRGSVTGLTPGRWFVYSEARDASGTTLEAWLPVESLGSVSSAREVYTPPSGSSADGRNAAGAVLLLWVAGLLITCLRLAGRVADLPAPREPQPTSAPSQ